MAEPTWRRGSSGSTKKWSRKKEKNGRTDEERKEEVKSKLKTLQDGEDGLKKWEKKKLKKSQKAKLNSEREHGVRDAGFGSVV